MAENPNPEPTLTLDELIRQASERAELLFAGVEVVHRSCGVAMAETFGRSPAPYVGLRRGGVTGCGECGAVKAGELILGELLSNPDPLAPVTPALRTAAQRYRALWQERVDRGAATETTCNSMTGQFAAFDSDERRAFCTRVAASVAACVATTLAEAGALPPLPPRPTR